MFQRGQKIIVLESSANKKTHPRAGDVGYLDNMYLFANDRFILISVFFFQYKEDKHNKSRIEKKKFVIDLGMTKNLKLDLDKGISISYFTSKDVINLTSTGYFTKKSRDGVERLIAYPLMHSNYGIWNNIRKDIKNSSAYTYDSKRLYKIPYGHIALFSSKYNSRYIIESRNDNEFIAWIKSMASVTASMLNIFHVYIDGNYDKVLSNSFKMAEIKTEPFEKYVNYLIKHDKNMERVVSSGCYISKDIEGLKESEKAKIVENVNFISSLNNMLIQRLDLYSTNVFNQPNYNAIRDYIKDLLNRKGLLLDKNEMIMEIMPTISIVRFIFYRSIIMPCNINEKIKLVQKYLPAKWSISNENVIKHIEEIKSSADNNSSALNRIYGVVKQSHKIKL